MKPTLRIGLMAAALAVAALPITRAADETQPPPPPGAGADKAAEQHPRRGPRSPQEQLQRLSDALSLTPQQKDQIGAIYKENAPQRQAIMNDESLSREDRRAKMGELTKSTQTKVRALLTPEQQQKFDTMPRPGWGRRGMGPNGGPPPGGNPPPANATPPPAGNT